MSYAHADREALLEEFAGLVCSLLAADKPVLIAVQQLDRWSHAFKADLSDADSHRVDRFLARIHARLTAIFEQSATDGEMPDSMWIAIDPGSKPLRFCATGAPADTEAVTQ